MAYSGQFKENEFHGKGVAYLDNNIRLSSILKICWFVAETMSISVVSKTKPKLIYLALTLNVVHIIQHIFVFGCESSLRLNHFRFNVKVNF